VKKVGFMNLCIVYDASLASAMTMDLQNRPCFYRLPCELKPDSPSGLETFPSVLTFPDSDDVLVHLWPNVCSLILSQAKYLNLYQDPLVHVDSFGFNRRSSSGATAFSYWISHISSGSWLVVVFKGAVPAKSSPEGLEFIRKLSKRLRAHSAFLTLGPSSGKWK